MRGSFFSWRITALGFPCAIILFALAVAGAPAATPDVDCAPSAWSVPFDSPVPAAFPLAADRFGWLWTFLENTLHSRARMVQFGVIGMCIALYFMFRARGT